MVARSQKEGTQDADDGENLSKHRKGVISKLKNEQPVGSPVARRLRSRNNIDLLDGLPTTHRSRKTIALPKHNEFSSQQQELDENGSQLEDISEGDFAMNTSQNSSTASTYGDDSESQVRSLGYSYCTIL
ncbi:unnamed protein product [Hymenolepis diminuta]|uniref:Uncharacterized protein n=1 Tax=Hymenolepis diminuta TaxID=6216 RepID=A0A0R3SHS4_HYMDI|nr:unnamed protein product [Hymenolepis diminuta]VUZ53640.1 unnamed protein product [Hymenolepis diminuta]